MENTLNILLKDTALKWYVVMNSRPAGPLSAKEIVQRLQANELNYADHVWKEGFHGWTRIYDVIDFKPLLPAEPAAALLAEIQKSTQVAPPPLSPKQKEELRTWYVHLDESTMGPISDIEVTSLIASGRITGATYMWQKGFSEWQLASAIPVWSKSVAGSAVAQELEKANEKKDKRGGPRKPFEAKIILTDGKEVGWAVCRDISIGGMQVLTAQTPGPIGTELKLNVSTHEAIPAFTCEGVIVRNLEDQRGFSFRFTQLSPDAKSAIEKYIKQ